jgi:hypothetical protein
MFPKELWLIIYGSLLWHREILAFVPAKNYEDTDYDIMAKCFFLSEGEAIAQTEELAALGVICEVTKYSLEKETQE